MRGAVLELVAGGIQDPQAEVDDLRIVIGPDFHAFAADGWARLDNDVENDRRIQIIADRPADDRLLRPRGAVGGQRLRRAADKFAVLDRLGEVDGGSGEVRGGVGWFGQLEVIHVHTG